VSPTLALDVPTNFFIASLLTLLATRQIRGGRAEPFGKYFWLAVGYAAWFAFVVAYPIFKYPDWMFVYFRDWRDYNWPLVYAAFASSVVVGAACGQMITQALVARGRMGIAVLVFLWGVAVYVAIFHATWDEYLHVGTYAEYLAGRAPLLKDLPQVQHALTIMTVLLAVPGLAIAAHILLEGRKFATARRAATS
jgi:hypothetical protein